MSFSARQALTEQDGLLVLQTPRAFWVKRGLVLLLLVPGLLVVLIGLIALLEVIAAEGPGLLTAAVGALTVLLGGPCVLVGGLHLLRAGPRAAASRVEIDRAQGELRPMTGPAVPLAAVQELELVQTRPLQKWHHIAARTGVAEASGEAGPYRPPRQAQPVVLLGNLNELELGAARSLLRDLGARLDLPVHDRSSRLMGGGGKGGAGLPDAPGGLLYAAAYLPF